jgi:hypothetical protein
MLFVSEAKPFDLYSFRHTDEIIDGYFMQGMLFALTPNLTYDWNIVF